MHGLLAAYDVYMQRCQACMHMARPLHALLWVLKHTGLRLTARPTLLTWVCMRRFNFGQPLSARNL